MSDLPLERIEILGLDHIYIAVSDFERAEKFYDTVLGLMDFRISDFAVGPDPHRHYFNKVMQISIRPARTTEPHDPYRAGLHHLCLQVADRVALERLAQLLGEAAIETSEPKYYPEYAEDYFAIFFTDPDGMRLEVVAQRTGRKRIVERWNELDSFLNPMSRLKP